MFERLKVTGQHTLVFGIGGALRQAVNFLLLPIYTRYLTPADYGILNLLLIAGSLISVIPSAAVGSSLFRSYYDYQTEQERSLAVSTALLLSVGLAAIFLFIGVFLSDPLSGLLTGDSAFASLTVVVLLNGALSSVTAVTQVVFRVQKWSLKYVLVSLSAMLVSLLVTIYLVVYQRLNIAGVIWGSFAGVVTSASLSLGMIRAFLQPSFSRLEIRKMMSYGLPLIPTNIIGFIRDSGDRLVIQALLGPAAVGVYALARRLGQVVQAFIIEPFNLILPVTIFSAEHDPRAKELYARLLTYYLLATAFVFLIVSVLANDLLRLISNPAYWSAASLVPWMCLGYILYGTRGLVGIGMSLFRKTYWYPVAVGAGAVVYLGLMMLFLPIWGIVGAAVSFSIGSGIVCLGYLLPGQRIFRQQFEVTRMIKLAGVVAVLGMVGLVSVESIWVSLILKTILLTLGMPLLLIAVKFLDANERKYLVSGIVYLQKEILYVTRKI